MRAASAGGCRSAGRAAADPGGADLGGGRPKGKGVLSGRLRAAGPWRQIWTTRTPVAVRSAAAVREQAAAARQWVSQGLGRMQHTTVGSQRTPCTSARHGTTACSGSRWRQARRTALIPLKHDEEREEEQERDWGLRRSLRSADKAPQLCCLSPCAIEMLSSVVGRGAAAGTMLEAGRRAWVWSTPHRRLAPVVTTQHSPSSSGRWFCTRTRSALEPPDVPRLAETARISLSPEEVEEFAPKIRQVVDWFGQLQGVNLENIDPALRADTDVNVNPREDIPETFDNREAMLAAVPSYEGPYIKVPKVLNKE